MRLVLAASCVFLALVAAGCAGGSPTDEGTTTAAVGEFGSYLADDSLHEKEVVEAYVEALDARDGARFCSVVAPWISGMFDIYGTDPEAPLSHPLRCPEWVSGFIGYIEDCCPPKFLGVEIVEAGELDRRGVISVLADVGLEGNRLALVVDGASFSTGRPFPGSVAPSSPLTRFQLRTDVTVELSDERHLHDDLGPSGAEGIDRFPYPQI